MTPIESKLIEFARWAITEHRSYFGDIDEGAYKTS